MSKTSSASSDKEKSDKKEEDLEAAEIESQCEIEPNKSSAS